MGTTSDSVNSNPRLQERIKSTLTLFRAGILFGTIILLLLGILICQYAFTSPNTDWWTNFLREFGVSLLVTGSITGFIYVFLTIFYDKFRSSLEQFVQDEVRDSLKRIQQGIQGQTDELVHSTQSLQSEIKGQTEDLVKAINSLDAMRKSGLVRVYRNRGDASSYIASDLTDLSIKEIQIIGISMNDFVQPSQSPLHFAWQHLKKIIKEGHPLRNEGHHLEIRVLIIDPECFGAKLRAEGESTDSRSVADRLRDDVKGTSKELIELERYAAEKNQNTGVTFQFRLYRLPPILFLCRTTIVSYLHQYYFWQSRASNVPIPTLEFRELLEPVGETDGERSKSESLHNEMKVHFDWIWQKASISSEEYLEQKFVGIDKGMYSTRAVNVFHESGEGKERILWLLENAKRRIYIQGISLLSFFDSGEFFARIHKHIAKGQVEIKVLLIDPDNEQAKYRSFREYLFEDPNMSFEEYLLEPKLHSKMQLKSDTQKTIRHIRSAYGSKPMQNFEVKAYNSAPNCFMLIVDDSLLIEQYHYGKKVPADYVSKFPIILGKDSPLIEYINDENVESAARLYKSNALRNPFNLMLDHFDFVFGKCAKPLDSLPDE